MLTARHINWPANNIVGPGSLKELGPVLLKLHYKNALLVTDTMMQKLGILEQVIAILESVNIKYAIYDGVKPNPTVNNVNEGFAILKQSGCDFIIALGGGSPQDTAKGIGVLATNGGDIRDYEGVDKVNLPVLPIVAINTTAGTGSEVTMALVITDEERQVKMLMTDPDVLATVSINDPELMVGKPPALTAATGMDALTHAIEAYVSKGATVLTDTLAIKAIELVAESLVEAVRFGTHLEARTKMAWASYMAGLAFSNAGLGICHSMAHQLGGMYDIPHGLANAILLPHVMEYNMPTRRPKFGDIARAFGKNLVGKEDDERAMLAVDAICELSERIGIPTLRDTKFDPKDVAVLAEHAMKDACTQSNPRAVTAADIARIYLSAYMAGDNQEQAGMQRHVPRVKYTPPVHSALSSRTPEEPQKHDKTPETSLSKESIEDIVRKVLQGL